MKRELRLPSKGYDLLRQQVQAKRGSMTNRDREEGAERAGALAETGADGAGETGQDGHRPPPAGEPAADGHVAESAASGDPLAASKAPGAAQDGPAVAAAAGGKVQRRLPKQEKPSPPMARPAEDARITLKVNVKAPAPGLFPFYDRVIETMPPRKALPLLLAKAFEDLEAAVAAGERLEPRDYASEKDAERVSTSRTMDVALFQAMRAQLDPFDLMRRTSLGSAIAKVALCRYLAKRS